nr:class I SAM-dependent methyltransferase [Marinicella sp. W31]MDC2877669.1 methyltransferase domain-containing protein [Marinicella sp. W31]
MAGTQPTETLHDQAAAMDAMYRYQRHIYDLTRKYYLFGRDRMIDGVSVAPGGSVLEIACGTGRNLRKLAARLPEARLYGLDISEEMLGTARAHFKASSTPPLFAAADACEFKPARFGVDGFDRIAISYALSMIPQWRLAVEAALDALNDDGELHVVDFGQQEGLPAGSAGAFSIGWRAFMSRPAPSSMPCCRARQQHAVHSSILTRSDAATPGMASSNWRERSGAQQASIKRKGCFRPVLMKA